mmetsp:Transcript_15837/g.23839  ORF Transcript_15837/g.23839 Transcript_15837/m.23839 type:complete len:101 (+) Transcript_15837:51-353(+)
MAQSLKSDLDKLVDHSSTHSYQQSTQVLVQEYQVAVESKKLLREELRECILRNHENANENCYDLRVKYVELLKDRFGGMVFPPGLEPKNKLRPRVRAPDE